MIEVEFHYEQKIIAIQTEKKNRFQDVIKKYIQKSYLNPSSLFFLLNGKQIEPSNIIENEINKINKEKNKLIILVNKIEQGTPKEPAKNKAKDINPSSPEIYIKINELENTIDNLNNKIKELEEKNRNKEKILDNFNKRIKYLEEKNKFFEDPIGEFIERLYREILGRKSEKEGFDFWTNHLKSKSLTGGNIVKCFFHSDEFRQLVKDKKISDEEYIIKLYRGALGRTPGEDEVKRCLQFLKQNKTRDNLLENITSSNEFLVVCKYLNL